MANYENLKSAIQQVLKTNGKNAITGALLQQSLLTMVNSLGAGYQFIGVATPTTNPGTPDKRVFYIASTAGTYSNFGGLGVTEDEVVVLTWDSSWHKTQIGTTKVVQGEPGPEGPQGPKGDKLTYADLTEADKADLYEGGASLIRPLLDGKQDTISDLDAIRQGAEKGSTALQSYTESDPIYTADKPNLALKSELDGKVDKEEGKGLSSNDYSNADKAKLSELDKKIDALALGAFYGYFPDSSSLPTDVTESGYAYVGTDNPYIIWNYVGREWVNSGVYFNTTSDSVIDFTLYHRDEDGDDYSNAMKLAIEAAHLKNKPIFVPNGIWAVKNVDIEYDNICIFGESIRGAVLYVDTWGDFCFRSSNDYLQISNLSIHAINHKTTKRDAKAPEMDNGASGILYKGNNGLFFNLYGEYIQNFITLGGDYLQNGEVRVGNVCHDLICKDVQFCVLGLQQKDCLMYNLSGTFTTFNGFNIDDTPFSGAPGHIVYISGSINKKSYNINIHDIIGRDSGDGLGILCVQIKFTDGLVLDNIYGQYCAVLACESVFNGYAHNLRCIDNYIMRYGCLIEYAYTSTSEYGRGNYPFIIDGLTMIGKNASLRFATSTVILAKNIYIKTDSFDTSVVGKPEAFIAANGASFIELDNVTLNGVHNTDSAGYNFYNVNSILRNDHTLSIDFIVSGAANTILYSDSDVENTYKDSAFKEVIRASNSVKQIVFSESGLSQNKINFQECGTFNSFEVTNDTQVVFNYIDTTLQNVRKVFAFTNNGTAAIRIRQPDISSHAVISNVENYSAGAILAQGSTCIYEIWVTPTTIIINRTDVKVA